MAIVTFMKNALTVINGSTPYQGLIGQQPALFPSLEGGTTEESGVEQPLVNYKLNCRHNARVRELAATNIIEAISLARVDRASKHQTRPDVRIEAYQPKELVDIWFEPTTKDTKGWRGPAEVVQVHPEDGNAEVRIQGRTLMRHAPEIRPHIAFLIFLQLVHTGHYTYWLEIKAWIEARADLKYYKVYGMIWTDSSSSSGLPESGQRAGNICFYQCSCMLLML